ncbi:MAG: hypothetical protein WCA08_23300, partial [Desulfoferrobacter sp.]
MRSGGHNYVVASYKKLASSHGIMLLFQTILDFPQENQISNQFQRITPTRNITNHIRTVNFPAQSPY